MHYPSHYHHVPVHIDVVDKAPAVTKLAQGVCMRQAARQAVEDIQWMTKSGEPMFCSTEDMVPLVCPEQVGFDACGDEGSADRCK